jgi:glycosyltransferase involved in cell wall biosynthesis
VMAPPQCAPEARTGWRVPAGDAEALAAGLRAALSLGASARAAMATRARAHVQHKFSLERMTTQTLNVYAALLDERARLGQRLRG